LESEEVLFQLKKNSCVVDALYNFFNTGEESRKRVCFHNRGTRSPSVPGAPHELIWFDCWVGGQRVAFSKKRPESHLGSVPNGMVDENRCLGYQITFPGFSYTKVRVTYQAPYEPLWGRRVVRYVYGINQYWKDSISRVALSVDGTEVGGSERFSIGPLPHHTTQMVTENAVRCEMRDFKPGPDGQLTVTVEQDLDLFRGDSVGPRSGFR